MTLGKAGLIIKTLVQEQTVKPTFQLSLTISASI
jgi:hypothetical protein